MKTLTKESFVTIAIALLCSHTCYSQDIVSDFQQALAMLPEQPLWRSGIMYYDMQQAADTGALHVCR